MFKRLSTVLLLAIALMLAVVPTFAQDREEPVCEDGLVLLHGECVTREEYEEAYQAALEEWLKMCTGGEENGVYVGPPSEDGESVENGVATDTLVMVNPETEEPMFVQFNFVNRVFVISEENPEKGEKSETKETEELLFVTDRGEIARAYMTDEFTFMVVNEARTYEVVSPLLRYADYERWRAGIRGDWAAMSQCHKFAFGFSNNNR